MISFVGDFICEPLCFPSTPSAVLFLIFLQAGEEGT